MKPLLIVDGYNLIHFNPSYKKQMELDLESARAALIEDLAAFATLEDYDVTVVFDAGETDSKTRHKATILGVEVVFTRGGESADAVIERFSFETGGDRRVVVATSDYAQQKVVFRPGVTVKSARQLVSEIEQSFGEALSAASVPRGTRRMPMVEERIDRGVKAALDRLIKGP
ncbi:MAG: NYN domain-containing protein [Candidatus Aquicultorales bacterium]